MLHDITRCYMMLHDVGCCLTGIFQAVAPDFRNSCPPCLVISYTRISRGPSTHKSGSLNNKYEYHSTFSQSTARKSACPCTNPLMVTSPEPRPKTTRKPFRGHGRRCRPRPPWPLQRSAARPQRRGLSEPRNSAPSGLGRRGCDAEGGAAAAAVEKQSVAMGCFSGWLGV